MMNIELIRENRKAIWFLLTFAGLYVSLNSAYGLFIQYYYPTSDPFTRWVASQVAWILSFFDPSVSSLPSLYQKNIAIINDRKEVIYVFEGCNGLNVMIVYVSFLIAFKGSMKMFSRFFCGGIVGLHLLNLARVTLLYAVALYFPDQLYFFHKYLFTGVIYLMVFALWYSWIRLVKK